MYDATIPIPSCASGKDVCIVCVSVVVCTGTDTGWCVIGSYKNVFSFHLWPQQSQLTLKTVQRLAVMIEPQQPGLGDAGHHFHCEEAGISEEKCYFAYWPPNEKAEQFLCCRRKMFIRAAASLKLPSVRTAALQHCSQGVNLEEQELVICDNLKVCRVFIQESQIVLLV